MFNTNITVVALHLHWVLLLVPLTFLTSKCQQLPNLIKLVILVLLINSISCVLGTHFLVSLTLYKCMYVSLCWFVITKTSKPECSLKVMISLYETTHTHWLPFTLLALIDANLSIGFSFVERRLWQRQDTRNRVVDLITCITSLLLNKTEKSTKSILSIL